MAYAKQLRKSGKFLPEVIADSVEGRIFVTWFERRVIAGKRRKFFYCTESGQVPPQHAPGFLSREYALRLAVARSKSPSAVLHKTKPVPKKEEKSRNVDF